MNLPTESSMTDADARAELGDALRTLVESVESGLAREFALKVARAALDRTARVDRRGIMGVRTNRPGGATNAPGPAQEVES